MTSDEEPCSQRGEEPPAETDNGEEVASPKRLRLNVDLDVKPMPHHGDWMLAPGFQESWISTRIASKYRAFLKVDSRLPSLIALAHGQLAPPLGVKKPYARSRRRWPNGLRRRLRFPSQRSGLASEGAAAHEARYVLFIHRPQQRLGADPVSEEQVVHFLASVADDRGAAAEVRQHPRHRMLHKLM